MSLVQTWVELTIISLLPLGNSYFWTLSSILGGFVINTITPMIYSISLAKTSQQAWHWQMETIIVFVEKVCTYVCLLLSPWDDEQLRMTEKSLYTLVVGGVPDSKFRFKSILDLREDSWYEVHAKEFADLSSDSQSTC